MRNRDNALFFGDHLSARLDGGFRKVQADVDNLAGEVFQSNTDDQIVSHIVSLNTVDPLHATVYEDTPYNRSLDRTHPRYALTNLIEREGIANVGLGYETIPGPQVCPLENIAQTKEGIVHHDGFRHLAFASGELKTLE